MAWHVECQWRNHLNARPTRPVQKPTAPSGSWNPGGHGGPVRCASSASPTPGPSVCMGCEKSKRPWYQADSILLSNPNVSLEDTAKMIFYQMHFQSQPNVTTFAIRRSFPYTELRLDVLQNEGPIIRWLVILFPQVVIIYRWLSY